MKSNVIFTDFNIPKNWEFLETLNSNGTQWIVDNKVNNEKTDTYFKKIKRYMTFILFPFSRFLKRNKYDKIIAWQQFYGLMFAFWCNFFKVKKKNQLIIMTFIYTTKNGILGKLKYKFINYSISNKYVDKIIVFSNNELEYYSKIFKNAKDKFVFMKLGVDKICNINSKKGDYLVSAGKSNRDYNFLINSFKSINEELKIISYTAPDAKSRNVEILRDVFDDKYLQYIAESFAVIVSLDDPNISAGQLVFIHAMQLGKPIICTKSNTISDYVIDGYNGYIIDKNINKLRECIIKLKNEDTYKNISNNAFENYKNNYTIVNMAENISKLFV